MTRPAPSDIFAADLATAHRARAAYRTAVFEAFEEALIATDPQAELEATRIGFRSVQQMRQRFEAACDTADDHR